MFDGRWFHFLINVAFSFVCFLHYFDIVLSSIDLALFSDRFFMIVGDRLFGHSQIFTMDSSQKQGFASSEIVSILMIAHRLHFWTILVSFFNIASTSIFASFLFDRFGTRNGYPNQPLRHLIGPKSIPKQSPRVSPSFWDAFSLSFGRPFVRHRFLD